MNPHVVVRETKNEKKEEEIRMKESGNCDNIYTPKSASLLNNVDFYGNRNCHMPS